MGQHYVPLPGGGSDPALGDRVTSLEDSTRVGRAFAVGTTAMNDIINDPASEHFVAGDTLTIVNHETGELVTMQFYDDGEDGPEYPIMGFGLASGTVFEVLGAFAQFGSVGYELRPMPEEPDWDFDTVFSSLKGRHGKDMVLGGTALHVFGFEPFTAFPPLTVRQYADSLEQQLELLWAERNMLSERITALEEAP